MDTITTKDIEQLSTTSIVSLLEEADIPVHHDNNRKTLELRLQDAVDSDQIDEILIIMELNS